jgi:murein DD-endopeptidase MepM/ murein hydrolase activator NlpD
MMVRIGGIRWIATAVALCVSMTTTWVATLAHSTQAAARTRSAQQGARPVSRQEALRPIYERAGATYDIPWALLAAIDRYAELIKSKSERSEKPWYGFSFEASAWSGIENPNRDDVNPLTISLFRGLGVDADGDRLALPWDAADRVFAIANWLDEQSGEDEFDTAIWDLFQDPIAMDRIFAFEKIFEHFGLQPRQHCFPVDKRFKYTVKHTFGARRNYGGRRIHEGVDIFADYGTPVLACSYAYVELIGWNRFGGWRIGLRDANNMYYYYGHLSAFAKGLKRGHLVRPGQVIGYVGSSGYGPPGTSGKFPPHLHFGVYRDTGRGEWAFSPSGLLNSWERMPQKVPTSPAGDSGDR